MAFEEFEGCDVLISFSLIDSDLNKLTPVEPKSLFLEAGLSPLTESKEVILNEFLEGKVTFFLDPGL